MLLSLCLACVSAASAPPALAQDGKSAYRIATPDRPSPATEYAASEFQRLLHAVSGVRLAVVAESKLGRSPAVHVGLTRCARAIFRSSMPSPEDGIGIRTAGRDLLLVGGNERGIVYAVYVFFERYLGVRYLAHDCTVIPSRSKVALPEINHVYAPPFMYRETLYHDSRPKAIAAPQRLNGPTTECDATVGGKIAFHPYVHSFSQLVPPDKYFAEHPEYFSLVGGKRIGQSIHGQLCLTNPDVLRIATQQVLQWIREHPDVPIIDVSQNDGNGACECEACRAVEAEEESPHGPIMRFVNAIADEVKKRHPDKWIETLAYAYSTKPPAKERPRDNVIIRLCHAGCYNHGFEQCGLGANLTDYLKGWRKLTRRIFVWHYAANFAHYVSPVFNLDGLAKDLKAYAKHGVNGVMVQANYQGPGGELAELRQYLASQLLWDPTRDPMEIRREFCDGYYGPASAAVLAFLALMDAEAARPDAHAFGAWDPSTSVRPEFVKEGLATLRSARERCSNDAERGRVDKLMLPLWYMQLQWPEKYGLKTEDSPKLVAEFRRVVERFGMTHVCEGGAPNMAGWLEGVEKRYREQP